MSAGGRGASIVGRLDLGRPTVMRRLATGVLVALALLAGTARADGPTPPLGAGPEGQGAAPNFSIAIQVLWQVQQGCKQYCDGSIQIQDATQKATTIQITAATTPAPGTSTAATNTSAVIQVVVQTQLGCVAFCSGTTRVQSAQQQANVAQLASAISAAVASAGNSAAVTQLVWQYQDRCEVECHDVSVSQTATQRQSTMQVATTGATPPPALDTFMRWLAGITATATASVVFQLDEATCLEHCAGDVQVQVRVQDDRTTQRPTADHPAVPPPAIQITAPVVRGRAPGTPCSTPVRAIPTPRHRAARGKHRGSARVVSSRCGRRRNRPDCHRNIRLAMWRRSMLPRTTTEGMRCGS